MTAVMAQMFAGREPINEETAFDIEFTDDLTLASALKGRVDISS